MAVGKGSIKRASGASAVVKENKDEAVDVKTPAAPEENQKKEEKKPVPAEKKTTSKAAEKTAAKTASKGKAVTKKAAPKTQKKAAVSQKKVQGEKQPHKYEVVSAITCELPVHLL